MNITHFGDCRDTMRRLIADGVRVQCCVTSPPYWGLRDYGHPGQIGLEATPAEYLANMVDVFGLVRNLLADDGALWLNLGDTYAAARSYQVADNKNPAVGPSRHMARSTPPDGLKPKDLCGIPWRVALALQAAGWWLRQDIIWRKPNPMPESVTDRCTKAHEYLFLLTKSERYYWDRAAMQERAVGVNEHDITGGYASAPGQNPQSGSRKSGNKERKPASARGVPVDTDGKTSGRVAGSVPWEGFTRNRRSVWTIPTKPYHGAHFAVMPEALVEPCVLATSRPGDIVFDPFMGSGTVARVAQRLGRQWLGCELNPDYEPLQRERTAQQGLAL